MKLILLAGLVLLSLGSVFMLYSCVAVGSTADRTPDNLKSGYVDGEYRPMKRR